MTEYGAFGSTTVDGIIESLLDAVEYPAAWNEVLAKLCDRLKAESALIRFYSTDWASVDLSVTLGFDTSFDVAYREHFVHVDPIAKAVEERLRPGEMVFVDELVPFIKMKRTEFYGDYLRPQDKRHIIGGYLYQEGGDKALIGLQRGHRGRPFERFDLQFLKALSPQLKQVLKLHQLIVESRVVSRTMSRTLDGMNIAAFYVDRTGQVRYTNETGDALLESRHCLTLRRGCLRAVRQQSDSQLQHWIKALTAESVSSHARVGGAVRLAPSAPHSQPMTALVMPWRRRVSFGEELGPRIVAAVLVGAIARPVVRARYLCNVYGLTPSEARLAAKLAQCCSLDRAADEVRITKQTSKSYLKSIFRKMGCHSQVELVAMILRSPSGLWGHEQGY